MTQTMQTVYKLVFHVRPQYPRISCITRVREWACAYIPGEPTYPVEGSYLFAFDTLEAAVQYGRAEVEDAKLWELWTAQADVVPVPHGLEARSSSMMSEATLFWQAVRDGLFDVAWTYSQAVPQGAVWCRSITLHEQVTELPPPSGEEVLL